MAWRPYDNLIIGELDNTTLGSVRGWIRFYREGKEPLQVTLDLVGNFHDDIRGTIIRITNCNPHEEEGYGKVRSYVDVLDPVQHGIAGDITAGRKVNGKYPYVDYPYVEWFSDANGRVVLELEPSQVEIIEDRRSGMLPLSTEEKQAARRRQAVAMAKFLQEAMTGLQAYAKRSARRTITN